MQRFAEQEALSVAVTVAPRIFNSKFGDAIRVLTLYLKVINASSESGQSTPENTEEYLNAFFSFLFSAKFENLQ